VRLSFPGLLPFNESVGAIREGGCGRGRNSPRPPKAALPAEVPELLGNEFGTGEIGFSKADDEELVGIRDQISIRVGDSLQEVVIVRDPESMKSRFSLFDVRAEFDTFDLGWNLCTGDAVLRKI
jgi:hypothetical protein